MLFRRSTCIFLLALCGFAATSLRADVTGSILGVVHDATQAVVAGVKIVATNVDTNLSKETTSPPTGHTAFLRCPPASTRSPRQHPDSSSSQRRTST